MQMNEQVLTALEVLRNFAENDFEKHRIDVLEKDLTAPPKVEVIDDKHQKFNGVIYNKNNYNGHYQQNMNLHRVVFAYYNGEIPKGYEIHHKDFIPANNDISNLQSLTKREHHHIHNIKPIAKKICAHCGKEFNLRCPSIKQKYCSRQCLYKAQKKLSPKICPTCGKIFMPNSKRSKQIYCSHNCYVRTLQKK